MDKDKTLGTALAEVCAAIKGAVPALAACEPLGNQLAGDALARTVTVLPAVYVACAGVEINSRIGREEWNSRYAAFLVVSDRTDPIQSADVLDSLIEATMGISPRAEFLSADNLYKGDAAKAAVNVYVVQFKDRNFR